MPFNYHCFRNADGLCERAITALFLCKGVCNFGLCMLLKMMLSSARLDDKTRVAARGSCGDLPCALFVADKGHCMSIRFSSLPSDHLAAVRG